MLFKSLKMFQGNIKYKNHMLIIFYHSNFVPKGQLNHLGLDLSITLPIVRYIVLSLLRAQSVLARSDVI